MVIYIVRHPETKWNKEGIFQGHHDSPLTEEGKQVAENLGRKLIDKKIERIYCSDLGRCVQTAEIINKFLNVKIVKSHRLREKTIGDLDGQTYDIMKKHLDESNPDQMPPNGESFNQMKARVLSFLKTVEDNSLIVSHYGCLKAILSDYYKVSFMSKRCDTSAEQVYEINNS